MADRPFSRHQRGDFQPANCIRCTRDTDLIDLGAEDIQFYGRVYLCTLCEAELAQMLGFVDGETASRTQSTLQAQLQEHRDALAAEKSKDVTPTLRKLERQANAIRSTADDLLRGISDRAGSSVPVPVAAAEPAGSTTVGVPVGSDGVSDPAGRPDDGISGSADGFEPVELRADDATPAGGDAEAAGTVAEISGPDLDASFGWLERGTEEGISYPAVDPDDVGD